MEEQSTYGKELSVNSISSDRKEFEDKLIYCTKTEGGNPYILNKFSHIQKGKESDYPNLNGYYETNQGDRFFVDTSIINGFFNYSFYSSLDNKDFLVTKIVDGVPSRGPGKANRTLNFCRENKLNQAIKHNNHVKFSAKSIYSNFNESVILLKYGSENYLFIRK
ncbi:MAG: hypothetical protein AB8E15_01745 [Bdellovibrionales bacterium]